MDNVTTRLWIMRLVYVLLALLVMFMHLLPLDTRPGHWPFPDLLLGLTFAWVLRRPEYVPLLSIAGIMLLADLLLQRPPGLLAALVVAGSSYLRSAAPGMRDIGFVGEWISVGAIMISVFALNRMVLAIFAVQQTTLLPVLAQLALTIIFYPLIVLISQVIFGVKRRSATSPDPRGGMA